MKQARACSGPEENWHHTAHVYMPTLQNMMSSSVELIGNRLFVSSLTHAVHQTALRHVWGSIIWVKQQLNSMGDFKALLGGFKTLLRTDGWT